MSLPPELRLLCHQLSSTPNNRLLDITPNLLRNVLRCQGPLNWEESTKSDASEISVLVHRLKTQLSTLLYGKTAEGRFTAVVLIKAIVAVGGWEVLRGVEPWVRGLLSVLGKNDPIPTKRLCILSLTSIYFLTYQYQSLVREVTTPTLPNFVSSCLSLISPKPPVRAPEVSFSLAETILESFCILISRHSTIFRPFSNQIKVVIRPYLAPTHCDRHFIPISLCRSARRVAVLLYQTSAKNTSGEEWGKGIRNLVRGIHGTVDQIYRAVIEDWEPIAGYVSQTIDINMEVQGGAKSENDLPAWIGIDAGIQRLEGMLWLLREHFMHQTATIVHVPLGLVVDLLTRLMSVVPPIELKGHSGHEGVRLHPAIDRHERDGLWAGLRNIHVVCMELYLVLVDRFQHNFISSAQSCLTQLAWIFSSYSHDEAFRCDIYRLMAKILRLCGSSLDKSAVALLTPVIRTCCKEISIPGENEGPRLHNDSRDHTRNGSSVSTDTFLSVRTNPEIMVVDSGSEVLTAARELLPLFLSHLPQQYLHGYLRTKIDQTAIIAHSKEAMLASVLNPFLEKNGRVLPSILPHLCRHFNNDLAVEALLRPRHPVIKQSQARPNDQQSIEESPQEPDDLMEDVAVHGAAFEDNQAGRVDAQNISISNNQAMEGSVLLPKIPAEQSHDLWGGISHVMDAKIESDNSTEKFSLPMSSSVGPSNAKMRNSVPEIGEDEDDSDESVHLTMDLSDSEDEITS